jgi:hypothetical protein
VSIDSLNKLPEKCGLVVVEVGWTVDKVFSTVSIAALRLLRNGVDSRVAAAAQPWPIANRPQVANLPHS